jgi:hypothetical protein
MNLEFDEIVSFIQNATELRTTSLSQYAKPAMIESPVFIQDKILSENICGDLLSTLYDLYLGYILVALKLNDKIDNVSTVRDYLSVVSTSSDISANEFLGADALLNKFNGSYIVPSCEKIVLDSRKKSPIPSGKLVEVPIHTHSGIINMYLNLNFFPRYFPTEIVEYIISTNFNDTIHNRWLRMRAGEIRFFNDFLLNLDKLDTRAKALRNDKDNALKDIFRHGNRSTIRQILNYVLKRKSCNLANAIMILDESDVMKYSKKYHIDFYKMSDRQKFFSKTYCMFVVLVDTKHSIVNIFTNAINYGAEYSYNELASNSASNKVDIMEMMEFISKNQMPKF